MANKYGVMDVFVIGLGIAIDVIYTTPITTTPPTFVELAVCVKIAVIIWERLSVAIVRLDALPMIAPMLTMTMTNGYVIDVQTMEAMR
jgi:hypothetical protein